MEFIRRPYSSRIYVHLLSLKKLLFLISFLLGKYKERFFTFETIDLMKQVIKT